MLRVAWGNRMTYEQWLNSIPSQRGSKLEEEPTDYNSVPNELLDNSTMV